MYSEEYEDPLYRKLSKILELTSLIFGHYKNQVARRAYEKGWISKARVKKIFHRGLEESFEGYRDGCLPPLYLDNMINYGKFYKYLSRC